MPNYAMRHTMIRFLRPVSSLLLPLAAGGFISIQGCQSLPQSFSVVQNAPKAEQLQIWNQLTASQQLASYRHHNQALGMATLLKTPSNADWRAGQEPALPEYDLWDRLRQSFAMDISSNDPRVLAEMNYYRRHPQYMDRVAQRASRYMFYVIEEIERRGLPGELALLPIVESAYDPFAYSHGRASGMWQFIPGTARHFGLENNWWYDGRRDQIGRASCRERV